MKLLHEYSKEVFQKCCILQKNKKVIALLFVFLYLFSSSFSDKTALAVTNTAITLDVNELNLTAGEVYSITVQVTPEDTQLLWTSSDYSVAVVNGDGMITGFSEGTAVITVSTEDNSCSAECSVNVAPLTPVDKNEIIRVKLSMGETTEVPFYIDGNYDITEVPDVSLPRQFYKVKLESGILNLYYGDKVIASGSELTFCRHAAAEDENNFLWVQNSLYGTRRYLGDMKFIIRNNAIQLINYIYIEEYLWGVVPHEMSNSFPVEALKAQAVAARTFTLRCIGGTDYDLGDTSAAQVYKGYHPANNAAIETVNATANKVLQYDNTTVTPTYYSASNGGWTDIPYHVWGGGYDWPFYIQYDPYDIANPSSPYEEVYFPISIDADHPVTSSDNVSGEPNIDNAIFYFKTEILNSGQLQSAGFSVASVNDFDLTGLINIVQHTHDSGESEDHSRIPNTGANPCPDYIMATADFKVLVNGQTENTLVSGVELDMRYFDGANDDDTYLVFNMTGLRLTTTEPKYVNEVLVGFSIYQRRYGHGVGMSQRGAQQRAADGQIYAEILSFYYPKSGIAVLNNVRPVLTEITSPVDNSNATVVCNDYLSVRISASTAAERIFTLPPGARIEVVQEDYNSEFHMINFGGNNYFVHSGYVTIDELVSAEGVLLDEENLILNSGETFLLHAQVVPENASNKNVIWKSANSDIASVDENGKVTANKTGDAIITVTTESGSFSDTCTITVIKKVTGVQILPEEKTMLVNDTFQLNFLITPSDATNKNITYTSDNTAVAQVDENGLITAIAPGTANITVRAEDGGYSDTCKLSVFRELITSDIYTVNRAMEYYEDIAIGTSVDKIVESVKNTHGQVIVFDENMTEVKDGDVSTGYYVQLLIDGEMEDSLLIKILGDCNPDEVLDVIDYSKIRLHILGIVHLDGVYLSAADVNRDGIIDVIDYTLIRLHILGIQDLY